MSNYTCHRIRYSGFPLWQKKNYRANFTSSINDSQHDQKESESSNVKPADRYIEKKKNQDWGHGP